MQALGGIDFNDLQGERSYSGGRAYNQSKLANVQFSYELARRLPAATVTANALHPGVTSTAFGAEDSATIQRLFVPFMRPFMKTPALGTRAGHGRLDAVRVPRSASGEHGHLWVRCHAAEGCSSAWYRLRTVLVRSMPQVGSVRFMARWDFF
jgi:NAD(P)-dependent dehydrogenase (short-subunit alcohol dehydrogenase family)